MCVPHIRTARPNDDIIHSSSYIIHPLRTFTVQTKLMDWIEFNTGIPIYTLIWTKKLLTFFPLLNKYMYTDCLQSYIGLTKHKIQYLYIIIRSMVKLEVYSSYIIWGIKNNILIVHILPVKTNYVWMYFSSTLILFARIFHLLFGRLSFVTFKIDLKPQSSF